ncbi:MAG: response regulator [Candidatus Omnitrophota bacterium]
MKILVVDDEDIIRTLLRRVLTKEGYKVLCVSDGWEAIECIKHKKLDLVLLDFKMPEIDGIQTLEKIRDIDKNIPVILISAYLTNETAKKATKLRIFNYIRKPFDLDELKLEVKKAFFA